MGCGKEVPLADVLSNRVEQARVWGLMGALGMSAAMLRDVLALRPSFAPALAGLTEAALAAGDFNGARAAAETLLSSGGRLPPGARVAYGETLLQVARTLPPKAAAALVREALKVDASRALPFEAEALRLLCKCYVKAMSADPALYACQRAVDIAPHQEDSRERLVWATKKSAALLAQRQGRARMRREQEERLARDEKAKQKKEPLWKWQRGDGDWIDGNGGNAGKGNKKGGGQKRKQGPTVPRGLYDALELKPSCDRADIKKAYHRLALVWHPDKHPDKPDTELDETKAAEVRFREIAGAYQELLARHPKDGEGPDAHCINC